MAANDNTPGDGNSDRVLAPRSPAGALNNPALLHKTQGKQAAVEPLHKRALAISEKALGGEHAYVAQGPENYAVPPRKTGRGNQAATMEAGAKAIPAKHRAPNPAK